GRAARRRQRARQAKPVLGRDITLGDSNEAGKTRLGGQQIVERGIESRGTRIVPNGKEFAPLIEQQTEVHGQDEGGRATREGGQAGRCGISLSCESTAHFRERNQVTG